MLLPGKLSRLDFTDWLYPVTGTKTETARTDFKLANFSRHRNTVNQYYTLATELNNRLIKAKRINVFVWWKLYQKLKAIIP